MSHLSIYRCHLSDVPIQIETSSGMLMPEPGSKLTIETLMFPTSKNEAKFWKENQFGIAGQMCEQAVQRVGAWNEGVLFVMSSSTNYDTKPNGPIRGSATMLVVGDGFGYRETCPMVRIGDTNCEFTRWLSASSMICAVPAMGTYAFNPPGQALSITMSTWFKSRTEAFSYDGPDLKQVGHVCANGKRGHDSCSHEKYAAFTQFGNLQSATSTELVVTQLLYFNGRDLAVADVTLGARVDGTACERTLWSSSSWVVCKHASGLGSSRMFAGIKMSMHDCYLGFRVVCMRSHCSKKYISNSESILSLMVHIAKL